MCSLYIQTANHTIKGDNSKSLFSRIMPLFRLTLFIPYQAPHSQALAPACGALVFLKFLRTGYRVEPRMNCVFFTGWS